MKYIVYLNDDYKNLIFVVDNFRPYNSNIFNFKTLEFRYNYDRWKNKKRLMDYLSNSKNITFKMDVECDSLEEVVKKIPPELFL